MKKTIIVLIYIFLITLSAGTGTICLWLGVHEAIAKGAASNWPTTIATIDKVGTYEHKDRYGTRYCPDLEYFYTISDVIYHSNRMEPTITTARHCYAKRDDAENDLKKLPIGSKISIRYNPQIPSQSSLVILKPIGSFELLLIISGSVFLYIGIKVIKEAWQRYKS